MIADLKPYEDYKESGLPWLGQVPGHWETHPAFGAFVPNHDRNRGMKEKTVLSLGMRQVFEAFRKEVLALDPCVSESFMKLYVAYKAETNFVDVVPQAQRLRLSINMTFAEINDPKGLCKDVTDLGRWGNGDVEVGLKSLDELPYVMGLVRQSYERQMGDGGQA